MYIKKKYGINELVIKYFGKLFIISHIENLKLRKHKVFLNFHHLVPKQTSKCKNWNSMFLVISRNLIKKEKFQITVKFFPVISV